MRNNVNVFETRLDATKKMLLNTLLSYSIEDCEFFIASHDDSINKRTNSEVLDLPIIVSTSCLDYMNCILCPDFTFEFCESYEIKNHSDACNDILSISETVSFENNINKIVWRGSSNTNYRSAYVRDDSLYSILNSNANPFHSLYDKRNYLSRADKLYYKYYLHLNGHNGNEFNGAYSSAFKYGFLCNSLVFYCAPAKYKEFWTSLVEENKHYIYCKDVGELNLKLRYYNEHLEEAKTIANNGFEFFKKYLLNYDNILYYMGSLLNKYSQKMNYTTELNDDDELIEKINYSPYLHN